VRSVPLAACLVAVLSAAGIERAGPPALHRLGEIAVPTLIVVMLAFLTKMNW